MTVVCVSSNHHQKKRTSHLRCCQIVAIGYMYIETGSCILYYGPMEEILKNDLDDDDDDKCNTLGNYYYGSLTGPHKQTKRKRPQINSSVCVVYYFCVVVSE